ncbi:MAG: hypothetical protein KDB22_29255 [Planctomycetales bacterium]|nr:hypothetical protein [Planctomycetales bacterium]
MHLRLWPKIVIVCLATMCHLMNSSVHAATEDVLSAFDGQWLYVEDITEGRAVEKQGPPMSVMFVLRAENDAVVYVRPRGDERISLDASAIEKDNQNGSVTRYSGLWNADDGVLEYKVETIRQSDNMRVMLIRREFRMTTAGLQVSVALDDGDSAVAIYQHPQDIALPEPAKATIGAMTWLTNAWVGQAGESSIEERWSPPLGGAMLGVARTVRGERMTGFEYLRIVQRDDGLVYVAQPNGNPPTEFVLTEIAPQRAVFVNPRHDYPQRIVYELSNDGALTTSIGFAKGGRPRSFDYRLER